MLFLLLSGCAGLYFRDAGRPTHRPPRFDLGEWPYTEYWTGIVFNGTKIGYSHVSILPTDMEIPSQAQHFDIRSELVLRFRFLMVDKRVVLRSYDRVSSDLSLIRFDYSYDLDDNRLTLSGQVVDDQLSIEVKTQDRIDRRYVELEERLYPTSAINLYPLLHGLDLGRKYRYSVFDGQTQTVSVAQQEVAAYEESDLFEGKAYRVKTVLLGQKVNTWMDRSGNPLLEMSLNGVIIAGLESEIAARNYLIAGAVNKNETMLEFSLIKTDRSIEDPERLQGIEIVLTGIDHEWHLPSDSRQRCHAREGRVICRTSIARPFVSDGTGAMDHLSLQPYLLSTHVIPKDDPEILRAAGEIRSTGNRPLDKVRDIAEWLRENIRQEPVDAFSALDVLKGRRAECQGHAFLYTAMARALGIPSRVVNGVVYVPEHQGFLYHTWAESWLAGDWLAIDPTFHQIPADATHVKLIEGENLADLVPLVDLVGRIEIQVTSTYQ